MTSGCFFRIVENEYLNSRVVVNYMSKEERKSEKATFAAGCFWGVEDALAKIPGVVSTRVGYTGGDFSNPSYEDVLSHKTGHAEAVEVTYDSGKVEYDKLLEIFWGIHNPTSLNRQGPGAGSNYRSAIFYHTEEQRKIAQKSREDLEKSGKYKSKIVTEIVPAKKFWPAEEYHQKYFQKTGENSCHI